MLKLISRAKWLLGGNIIFAFSQWLILTIIAKSFSDQALGQYSYALSIAAPIFMLTNLQLRPILIADYNSDKYYKYESFFSLRFYTNLLGLLIVLTWGGITNFNSILIIGLVAAIKFLEGFSDIVYAMYNARNETQLITKSLTLKSIISIGVLVLMLYVYKSFFVSVFIIFFTYLIVLIFLDLKAIKVNVKWLIFDVKELRKIVVYAFPLGFTVMLISLQTNMPRYFIEHYQSIEKVGIFTIFYYFIIIGGIFISSICQYLSPYYSISWNKKNYTLFFKYTGYSWLIAGFFGLCAYIVTYFFGNYLISLIYGNKFSEYTSILNILMIAGVFVYLSIVNGYTMTSIKIIKAQVPMFLFLLILTIICSWYLIPKYALVGAAWVSVITAFAQFVMSSMILANKIRGKYATI